MGLVHFTFISNMRKKQHKDSLSIHGHEHDYLVHDFVQVVHIH